MSGRNSGEAMKKESLKVKLLKKQARVLARVGEEGKEEPVKILWLRPVTGRGREVSIMSEDKKELVLLDSLDVLDAESRKVAEEALAQRYLVPRITSIPVANATMGYRYLSVETDHGPRNFVLRDPNTNVVWVSDDMLTIRDTLGNRYEIESLAGLDERSRENIKRLI